MKLAKKEDTNEDVLRKMVEAEGLTYGSCDDRINKLNRKNLNKIINEFFGDSGDTDVFLNRKLFVVETTVVDDEVDFGMISQAEYISRYGDERWEE